MVRTYIHSLFPFPLGATGGGVIELKPGKKMNGVKEVGKEQKREGEDETKGKGRKKRRGRIEESCTLNALKSCYS